MAAVEAIEWIPVEQRTAIEFVYFLGFTHSEVAARLHEPIGSVKTRIKLGIASLLNTSQRREERVKPWQEIG